MTQPVTQFKHTQVLSLSPLAAWRWESQHQDKRSIEKALGVWSPFQLLEDLRNRPDHELSG